MVPFPERVIERIRQPFERDRIKAIDDFSTHLMEPIAAGICFALFRPREATRRSDTLRIAAVANAPDSVFR